MYNVLSEAERYFMSVVWLNKGDALNLYDVSERIKNKYGRDWKGQTTATFATRLEKKGFIEKVKCGRYTTYRPLITLEEYRLEMLKEYQTTCFNSKKEMKDYLKEVL